MNNESKRLLHELREIYGAKNVTGIWFSKEKAQWILTFAIGEDELFNSLEELITWIKIENSQD